MIESLRLHSTRDMEPASPEAPEPENLLKTKDRESHFAPPNLRTY